MARHGAEDVPKICYLCNQNLEESVEHIFFQCPVSKQAYGYFLILINKVLQPKKSITRLEFEVADMTTGFRVDREQVAFNRAGPVVSLGDLDDTQ